MKLIHPLYINSSHIVIVSTFNLLSAVILLDTNLSNNQVNKGAGEGGGGGSERAGRLMLK